MIYIKLFEEYINSQPQEIIAYHSTNDIITNFNFKDVDSKSGSSTRINAIFFSNTPQTSWGQLTVKKNLTKFIKI